MTAFGRLVLPKWLQVKNTPKSDSRAHGLALGLFFALGLAFWLGLFLLSWWFFSQCLQVQLVGQILVRRLLDMVFLTFLSVLLFSNVVTAFTTLLLADDLSLLIAAPVPTDRLYHARLAETLVHSSWMVLIFGLPILAAAGVSAMLAAWPAAYDAIRYIGAAYLVFLAVQAWRHAGEVAQTDAARRAHRAIWRGFVTNVLNPKTGDHA